MKDNLFTRTAYTLKGLTLYALFSITLYGPSQTTFAQGTPWIAEPRTGSISLSYYSQNSDKFYFGTDLVDGPSLEDAEAEQITVWLHANYAITDAIAVDLQTAWARNTFDDPVNPSDEEHYGALYDSNVSVTWRFVDELVRNHAPSIAARVGVTIPGKYKNGYISSLGDGASGVEGSLIVGKFWDMVGASGEIGYRHRGSSSISAGALGPDAGTDVDVPSEIFLNLWVFVPIGNRIRIGGNYRMINAISGSGLKDPDFPPSQFPNLQEDIQFIGGQVFADLLWGISANAFFGNVIDGRNTLKLTVSGVGLNMNFGGRFRGGM